MTVLAALEVASVMDTWTPGIAAPDSPLTVPVIDPPATCALIVHGIARVRSRPSMAAIRAAAGLCRNLFFAWFSLEEVKLGSMKFCEARERPGAEGRSRRFCHIRLLLGGHHHARSQIVAHNRAALHHELHSLHL